MVLVVTLAAEGGDHRILDAALHVAWHIVVDGREAAGHPYGFGTAELRTAASHHFPEAGVDDADADRDFQLFQALLAGDSRRDRWSCGYLFHN